MEEFYLTPYPPPQMKDLGKYDAEMKKKYE
jgi:hypothetical protein